MPNRDHCLQYSSLYKPFSHTPFLPSPRSLLHQIPHLPPALQPHLVLDVAPKHVAGEQHAHELGKTNRVLRAAEEDAGAPAGAAPLLDGVDAPLGEQLLVAAGEGGLLRVPQRLEGRDQVLERRVDADQDVDGPRQARVEGEVARPRLAVVRVVFEVVLQEELQHDVDGEDVLVQVDPPADFFRFERYELPRLGEVVPAPLAVHLVD